MAATPMAPVAVPPPVAPTPPPVAQAPPAAPANPHTTNRVLDLLTKALPVIASTIAQKQGGPLAGAAVLSGYANQKRQMAEDEAKRLKIMADTQNDQMAWAERMRQHELENQQRLATYVTDIVGKLSTITDPVAYASVLNLADTTAAQAFGVEPGFIKSRVTVSPELGKSKEKSEAEKLIATLQKQYGPQFNDLLASGATVPWKDGRKSIRDLSALAGLDVQSAQGSPVMPVAEEGPVTEGVFISRALKAATDEKGRPLTPAESRQTTLKAREDWANSARAGDDPLLTALRQARIDAMKSGSDLSPTQFNMANKLADDFTRDSKDFISRAASFGTVLSAASDPSAAGDLSLIFAYMKMLDPGSVVREGEFATAQNAAGVPDRIRNLWNRTINGERLNPAQRADFVKQARSVYQSSKQRQQGIVRQYTAKAQRAKLPVDLVVTDYSEGVETPTSGAPTNTPSGPTIGERRTINGQLAEWDGRGWKAIR